MILDAHRVADDDKSERDKCQTAKAKHTEREGLPAAAYPMMAERAKMENFMVDNELRVKIDDYSTLSKLLRKDFVTSPVDAESCNGWIHMPSCEFKKEDESTWFELLVECQ